MPTIDKAIERGRRLMEIKIDLHKSWGTVDETIDFFLNLVLELQVLKRLPDPPGDLFVTVGGIEITDEQQDKIEIYLTNI